MASQNQEESLSFARQAYDFVYSGIISGELQPGARLSLRPLGKALGMGKAPISEALRELAKDGLIDLEPGACASVRRFGPADIQEQHVMRIALECEAARRCAAVITSDQLAELMALADKIDQNVDERTSQKQMDKSDFQLHMMIASISQCGRLVDALKANQLERLVSTSSALIWNSQLGMPEEEHRHLIEAIGTHDPDKAEQAMRKHCVRAMKFQLDALGFKEPPVERDTSHVS